MYEEIHYEKPFLKQVVVRLDFVAPLPGIEKSLSARVSRVLSNDFPIVEPQDAISIELKLGGGDPQKSSTPYKQWTFYGREREKQLVLAPQFMYILYNNYTSYEDMRETATTVITAMDSTYPDTRVGRFGLRYINSIEVEGLAPVTGWDAYISPVLTGATPFFNAHKLTRFVQIAELKCAELDLRFQFGLPNPDYPSLIRRPSFVLDFDAYLQTAHELSTSPQHMAQAHECIQDLFEKSITNGLRERMNVRTAAPVQE